MQDSRGYRSPQSRLDAPGEVARAGRRLRVGPGGGTVLVALIAAAFLSLVAIANALP